MEAEPPGDLDHDGSEDSLPTDADKPADERRWQLAARRKRQGFSQEQLAEAIGVAPVTIRRWERGGSEVTSRRPLARALDVSMDRLEKVLHNEDGEDEEPPEQVRPLVPEGVTLYLSMEHSASLLQAYQPHFVHGLLQTSAYARALVRSHYQETLETPYSDPQVERLVGFRTHRRQEPLLRPDDPLELDLVLYEAALRHFVDSHETMRRQLEYVVEMAERPNITVRVLPFSSGPHSATYGRFAILTFPWEEDVMVGYVSTYLGGSSYVEARREIDHLASLYSRIRTLSLSPEDSVDLIRRIAVEEFS